MNAKELKLMEKFEKTYWWHIGKKNLVETLIKNLELNRKDKILEIGCGTGEITEMLTKYGDIYANDIADLALEAVKKRGIKNTILGDIVEVDINAHKNKFKVVLALDVLEHIKKDVYAMERINSILTEEGVLIVTVPAYKFLWSTHDEALEHQRRYTDFEIKTKLQDTGFEILKQTHFVFFSFPLIALVKFMSNFFSKQAYPESSYINLSKPLNDMMVYLLKVEEYLMDFMNLPFGTTIVVVAKKQSSRE